MPHRYNLLIIKKVLEYESNRNIKKNNENDV